MKTMVSFLYLSLFLVVANANPTFSSGGSIDQCEFIRKALQKPTIPGEKLEINIPAGTFECKSMIVVKKSYVTIRGAGQGKTVLKLADQSHAPVLVLGDERVVQNSKGDWVTATRVRDIEVSDLTVDGNRANQDTSKECGNGHCDGDVANIRNNAITIRGASNVRLKRVTAHSAISGGLVTEKYCDHLQISDFTSYGNFFDGFAGYQTEDSLFENVNLSRNRGAGISIDIDFNKNRFSGGLLASNGDVGIFARDTNDVIFEKLKITRSGNHGVFLAHADHPDTCANRNEFKSVVIDNSKGHGIHLSSPCTGNRVTGNSVIENNKNGCFYINSETKMRVDSSVLCKDLAAAKVEALSATVKKKAASKGRRSEE